jgi:threonine dehydrogenase-like Zn-dependent dehydrogenase
LDNAVLVEALAAALHPAKSLDIRAHDRVAVLGPHKLGMLVIAALRAERPRLDADFEIVALARRPELLVLAEQLGADRSVDVGNFCSESSFEVVIDCTGTPARFDVALTAATRELHLKSTSGQPAGGIEHLTELIVDELALELFTEYRLLAVSLSDQRDSLVVGWVADGDPPAWLESATDVIRAETPAKLLKILQKEPIPGLPRVDAVVVDSPQRLVEAIRPPGTGECSPVRPTGTIFYKGSAPENVNLLANLRQKNLRLSSSRCGDVDATIELLASDPLLQRLGTQMITHRYEADDLPAAFDAASTRDCVKAIVNHP